MTSVLSVDAFEVLSFLLHLCGKLKKKCYVCYFFIYFFFKCFTDVVSVLSAEAFEALP